MTSGYSFDNVRSIAGYFALLGLAWFLSSARQRIPVRTVLSAIGLQVLIGLVLFAVPQIRAALNSISTVLEMLLAATAKGSQFVFGYLAGSAPPYEVVQPENNFILAFQILPLMIVISAIAAMLWHLGILSRICRGIGFLLERSLGLSGPVGLGTAASIFLGMVEAPLIVRPYLERMSRADIFLIMTVAMATVAGTVMGLYIALLQSTIPDAAAHVIVASFMAAPAAVALSRIMQPPESEPLSLAEQPPPKLYQSTMDAFSRGVQDGVNVFISVLAMIVVSVAIITFLDMCLAALLPPLSGEEVSVGRIFGWGLSPLMYMLGIPWEDCIQAGRLVGTKTVLNELLAFIELANVPEGDLSPRSRMMMIYILCGFANFGALAIMLGGLTAMCPARRSDFMDLGLKSMWAGIMTNLTSGALIGMVFVS